MAISKIRTNDVIVKSVVTDTTSASGNYQISNITGYWPIAAYVNNNSAGAGVASVSICRYNANWFLHIESNGPVASKEVECTVLWCRSYNLP